MQSFEQAAAYIQSLTGDANSPMWFRCIHDADKGQAAHKYYGTLTDLWQTLCDYNNGHWGIFANINAFPETTQKHELSDVWYIRTQAVDLDNIVTARQNYELIQQSNPPPTFAVQSSPGKYHGYWTVQPYSGNDRYNTLQRKLRQLYDGDKAICDPTRVLRVPGFYNHKYSTVGSDKYVAGAAPHLVTCWSLAGVADRPDVSALEVATAHVNVIEGSGGRHDLGDPELTAPSLDWLRFALSLIDPNELTRGDWVSATAAFKQAGWLHADEATLFAIWSEWCARYAGNDPAENAKNWNSIRSTETGWKSMYRRAPTLKAYESFGFRDEAPPPAPPRPPLPVETQPDEPQEEFSAILSPQDCARFFRDCFFIGNMGKILTSKGRFMNATQFNGWYGGKIFVVTPDGKTSNEPWAAATRSTEWTIPKVDHIRFVPTRKPFEVLEDQLGRKGVNTYIPIRLRHRQGDVMPWLRHMEHMLPVEADRQIFYSYLAHNVKYPGHKIPWAPMIQSAEGVGKQFIKKVAQLMLGEMYTYNPPAMELVSSGSTFNSWQRGKLMIVVDEIKIDERRELIEIMKPWISDERIQIQSKGENQEMEDNPANWMFFSNYKDAIPITQSGRRYCIFYSAIQSSQDLFARGMNDAYFNALFAWHAAGGQEHIVDWLLNYPIERGAIPMRAPHTSSHLEAVRVSRGPIEVAIANAVEDGVTGFRGGYISTLAVINRLKQLGGRLPAHATVCRILEAMGYIDAGRAVRSYGSESMTERAQIYTLLPGMPVGAYGKCQGYE